MTNQQIELVQQSWLQIKPVAKQAGLLFYERLFIAAPSIRHLFTPSIDEQAGKLITMLSYVVTKLNRLEDIVGEVQQLGVRHNQYGAKPEHYDVVGQCLIATLKDGLNDKWNDELEKAWHAAFTILKNTMVAAQKMD
jgi:nitric oxide dioxygenase